MALATFSGLPVVTAEVVIPEFGVWHADVLLDRSSPIPLDGTTLTIGNLSMRGVVFRAGSYAGALRVRMIGGNGGWRKDVPGKFYSLHTGLTASMIVQDCARSVGETAQIVPDTLVGEFFVRMAGPASRVFDILGLSWYVGLDGVTTTKTRPETIITSKLDVLSADFANGRFLIGSEFPEDWIPGRHFSSPTVDDRRISAVCHHLDRGKLRVEVFS